MAKTITANRGAIYLNTTTSTYNPLTILGGVTVSALSLAVYGDNSQAWSITNAGSLIATGGYGVVLMGKGTVTNSSVAARISGGVAGIVLKGTAVSVSNLGSISGGSDGVILRAGGSVSNFGAASISGGLNGVYIGGGAGGVYNYGEISGTRTNANGVFLTGGTVHNATTAASISGGAWGVFLTGSTAGTVINQGTISGGTGAVRFGNANGNLLYLAPGAVTDGIAQGGTGTDTLALGAGYELGVLSGIGSEFTGFETLDVTGQWALTGANTIAPAMQIELGMTGLLRVTGTLTAPGNLTIVSSTGTLAAGDGGRIEVGGAGTARAGQIVVDAGHTLVQSGTYAAFAAPVIINRGSMTGVAGLYLGSPGTVTNSGAAASISGVPDGVRAKFAATITNEGTISGSRYGIVLKAGGSVTNSGAAARITGQLVAVFAFAAPTTVSNQGTMTGLLGNALYFGDGGTVNNLGTAAVISASVDGLLAKGAAATVTNQGAISQSGGGGVALFLDAGGVVTNAGTGATISGGLSGQGTRIFGTTPGTVTNQGVIFGGFPFGIELGGGGTVANNGTAARITGGKTGVIVENQSGTVTNQGTITGQSIDGVALTSGGVLTNSGAAASISGASSGVLTYTTHTTITNQGRITSSLGEGAQLQGGGTIVNRGGALIAGAEWGVYAVRGAPTITNQGTITGASIDGVYLADGGAVSNAGAASDIAGGQSGVYATGAAATVTNQGSITGNAAYGVFLAAGGLVTNSGVAAQIDGTLYGIGANRVAVTIVNQGTVSGNDGAIYLGAGGTVENAGTAAFLNGGRWGIYAYGGVAATVTNQGTVSGGNGAVHFDNANGNLFQDFPKAVADGVVQGGTRTDTLELGSAATAGAISGIGAQFTGFEVLSVDAGAVWSLTGANTLLSVATIGLGLNATLDVTGALTAPANLKVNGTGTLVAAGGHVEVGTAGTATANQVAVDAAHTLTLSGGPAMPAAIVGTVANAGAVLVTGGHGAIDGPLTGAGTLQVNQRRRSRAQRHGQHRRLGAEQRNADPRRRRLARCHRLGQRRQHWPVYPQQRLAARGGRRHRRGQPDRVPWHRRTRGRYGGAVRRQCRPHDLQGATDREVCRQRFHRPEEPHQRRRHRRLQQHDWFAAAHQRIDEGDAGVPERQPGRRQLPPRQRQPR